MGIIQMFCKNRIFLKQKRKLGLFTQKEMMLSLLAGDRAPSYLLACHKDLAQLLPIYELSC